MATLHPEIDTHAAGHLDVGQGQRVFWETSGTPAGLPVLILHGGPGSGSSPRHRRWFDPTRYRIVAMDQRGAGRSTPHASEPAYAFDANTTAHLIADIEHLRRHLGIARWLVLGLSWGSTLALAYAQRHQERVRGLVLAAVTTTSAAEIDWITRGVRAFLPEPWERFRSHVPEATDDGAVLEAYRRRLADPDPTRHGPAAAAWCAWELAVAATPGGQPSPRWADPRFRLGFARLVTHYWGHRAWLADGALLAGAATLAGVPAVLIHGTLDLGSPPVTAWRLHRAWPESELVLVDGAGHGNDQTAMQEAILDATARFACDGGHIVAQPP